MIKFVNAKLNLGLNVVGKRPDGYHDLETVFYPIGKDNGTPIHPHPFNDIIEAVIDGNCISGPEFILTGRKIDCPIDKNLVYRATLLFLKNLQSAENTQIRQHHLRVILDKHLPDGAGLGGGSADASFTLTVLNDLYGQPFSNESLEKMALELGADCPFFIKNTPCFAEGVGEIMTPLDINLSGNDILIVKPDVHVSTRDAFAGIKPRHPDFNLRHLNRLPLREWKYKIRNDFETTVFARHPEIGILKESLYGLGAEYASMSGSGSSVFGIFPDRDASAKAYETLFETYKGVWLFNQ